MQVSDFFDAHITEPQSATIGVFDGVHKGHQALLSSLHGDYPSCVITFKQNPVQILKPDLFKGSILTLEEKLDRFAELGIVRVLLIDFSLEFSKMTGRAFIQLLKDHVQVHHLAIGYDFRFGHKAGTDGKSTQESFATWNLPVEIIEPYVRNNIIVSSTSIRKELALGNIQNVNDLLGYNYPVTLDPEIDAESSKAESGLYIKRADKLYPANGTYVVRLNEKKADVEIRDKHLSFGFPLNRGKQKIEFLYPKRS